MSSSNNALAVYWSDYPNNSNVQHVYFSTYPNNPGVRHVYESSYPNNPGVQHAWRSDYPNNSNVQHIYMTGCFPESELVHTCSDEYVSIGSLKKGDKINSWDVEKKKMQYTSVTKIHKYTVNDIICFNNNMRVSSSHPLMVVESGGNGIFMPKWKVAFDVNVGDCVVGSDGKLITVKTKSRHWHNDGIKVLNLSTDNGVPFIVGNFVVRAENAQADIEWADTPLTQKLAA